MNRAVFLDRDGVINRVIMRSDRPYSPTSLEEIEFLPGVGEAVEALRRADYRIIIVTNQPDVALGRTKRETVEAIHERLSRSFPIDDIKVCYHVDEDDCSCRKPKPGMLLEAARQWSLNLPQSYMVGDRWRDIGAGKAAGCKTILVGDGYGEKELDEPDAAFPTLLEASLFILSSAIPEKQKVR